MARHHRPSSSVSSSVSGWRRARRSGGLTRVSLLCLMALSVGLLPGVSSAAPDEESARGRPFLWRIGVEPPSYLFGTIHLPDDRVLDLHPAVAGALDGADVVYTETPMDAATEQRALQLSVLPAEATLGSVLPQELYLRLERYLVARGIPMLAFSRLKVWTVAVALPMLEWMQQGQAKPPLDKFLAQRASSQGKQTDALETVEEQVAAMESMGQEAQVAMLRQTLEQLESAASGGTNPIEELLLAYLTGNEDTLLAVSRASMPEDDPLSEKVEKVLIFDRNGTMSETIRKKLAAAPGKSHFFAVGALHYPGERGIIALLRKQGLEVERVDRLEDPTRDDT